MPPMPTKWILWILANMEEKLRYHRDKGKALTTKDTKVNEGIWIESFTSAAASPIDQRDLLAGILISDRIYLSFSVSLCLCGEYQPFRTNSAAISAISAAARGCDRARAFCAMICNLAGSESALATLSINRSTESSASGINSAALAFTSASALRR